MTDLNLNQIIRDHAMLVSVHVKCPKFEVKDAKAAQAAARESGALSSRAFHSRKNLLFTADARLKRLQSLGNALRARHVEMTMAWDTGKSPFRMLPTMNFMDYTKVVAKAKKDFDDALTDFIAHYDEDCLKARKALNVEHDVNAIRMYPHVDTLREKFAIDVTFEPIPEGSQFRNIPDSAKQALSSKFEEHVSQRFHGAITECYENIRSLLENARKNLQAEPEEGKGQRWKDSSITNIVEAARIAKSFNMLGDAKHDEFCADVVNHLGDYTAKEFKELRKADSDRNGIIDMYL